MSSTQNRFQAPHISNPAKPEQLHSWAKTGLQNIAVAIFQPLIFLPGIIWLLGGSWANMATIAITAGVGCYIGPLLLSLMNSRPEGLFKSVAVARIVVMMSSAMIAFLGWRVSGHDLNRSALLITAVLCIYFLASFPRGMQNPTRPVIQQIHAASDRSRRWIAVAALVLGSLIVWRTLANDDLEFGSAVGMLLFLGGIASISAAWFQGISPRQYREMYPTISPVTAQDIRALLSLRDIRKYVGIRLLYGLGSMMDPFIIVYGITTMHLGLNYVGAAVFVVLVGVGLGNMAVELASGMLAPRRMIQLSMLLRLMALTLALAAPFIASSGMSQSWFSSSVFTSWIFIQSFGLLAMAHVIINRAELALLINNSDPRRTYPLVVTLLGLVLTISAFSPLAGLLTVQIFGLETGIAMAAILTFGSLIATAFLVSRRKLARRKLTQIPRRKLRQVRHRAERSGSVRIRRIR